MKAKRIISAFMFCLATSACNNKSTETTTQTTAVALPDSYDFKKMQGIYGGDFGESGDIRLVLHHITGAHAVGYSLHKGLRRNMSGSMSAGDDSYLFNLQEPGDNPYDGTFRFSIDPENFILTGIWSPLNSKGLSTKSFTLKKISETTDTARETAYDPMQLMYDSTGEFHFEPGGLCIYRYYTDPADTTGTRQYEEIKGNWKKNRKQYIIDWQKNRIFPVQSHFQIIPYPETEEGYYYLEGEGRKLEPQLAG